MIEELANYFDIIQTRFDSIADTLSEIGDDVDQLNWMPVGNEQPSIFRLVAFIALNADYWIGHLIGGRGEPAGFDSALDEASGTNPDVLRQLLSSALETVREVFEDIKPNKMNRMIEYADEIFTPRQCIIQVIDQAAARYGEIEVIRRWYSFANPDYLS
ncbi:MAG: hypothetical protein HXX08_06360 [Chloroflexi bacterium]|uniref:DinB-like domain-containing protein n=1 Tax=Candidatus Chlorohelix allophototropha TaxID=3003348 RepID=A0A8T7LTZ2_9CHLR|nr:hypothetical protein [Chloroflexota bacterium]WJW67357.1 hypothetical protein OZ401_000621 [Chloroflexota bacterium L227-S17]